MPLKNADAIIGPALDEFYVRRPKSFQHLNLREGVYWHPFAAHRGQVALALQYAASLIEANSLRASGQDLRDYVASEFTDPPAIDGTYAHGQLTLVRPTSSELPAGDIPKGSRVVRQANLTTQIPLKEATFETLADAHIDAGQLESASIPIKAAALGATSNHPTRSDNADHGVIVQGSLFDPNLTVSAFEAAGGSDNASGEAETAARLEADEYVRQFARAWSKGSSGPNIDASRFGALSYPGVRHHLVYDDVAIGAQRIMVADSSWASSARWLELVQQWIYDENLVGFGCRVVATPVRNKVISISANITVRDWNYASNTLELDEAVRKAVRAYFDDRLDWNIWKARALRNAITRAHWKILKCSSVTVFDTTGAVLPEIASPDYSAEQFHYYLANNAVTATYTGPG